MLRFRIPRFEAPHHTTVSKPAVVFCKVTLKPSVIGLESSPWIFLLWSIKTAPSERRTRENVVSGGVRVEAISNVIRYESETTSEGRAMEAVILPVVTQFEDRESKLNSEGITPEGSSVGTTSTTAGLLSTG